jgi:hypothetical protein
MAASYIGRKTKSKKRIKLKKMKKTILAAAMVLLVGLSAFADKGGEVNKQAMTAFGRDFATARNAVWEQTDNFTKVTFRLNDQVLFAFYNCNGELQAVMRNILSDQLPLTLLADLKKNYNGFWISELFEMASDDRTTYYVSLENADKTIVLKSEGTDSWSTYSKVKKDTE